MPGVVVPERGASSMAAPPQQQQQPPPLAQAPAQGPPPTGAPPGQQQQQQPPQAQAAANAASLQAPSGLQVAAQAQDFDPVQRFRLLLPQLKESLQNLMKVAAQNFVQNTNIDNGQKSTDGPVQRVDKTLEEFYALCDQLELCLRLAYECLSQSFDSAKHSPTLVPTATKPDAVQAESLPYTQYLSMIKSQISCAKDIHNALLECSNKITGKVPSQGVL
ncbi:mediator of RNA polymerase II transcription subunit 29 [Sphaerodactylus townsendi]|nr:mediator of RNA polymerase II transcription subunit 29 [Sphaerodactylus townsendi]